MKWQTMVVIGEHSHASRYSLGMLSAGHTFLEAVLALAEVDGICASTNILH